MKDTIQVVLVILVILFVVIIVSNYFTLQAVTGNAMHAAMSNIVWTTVALQDAETDKERSLLLADLSPSIRYASQTVKLVADKTIFFDGYDLRQLWTYVAFLHAEGETDIDGAVIKIQDLSTIVEKTGILDITADKGYMYISDPKGCKEKLQPITKNCNLSQHHYKKMTGMCFRSTSISWAPSPEKQLRMIRPTLIFELGG